MAREDEPVFVSHQIREREPIELGPVSVVPIHVTHTDLETYGFRITGGDSTLAYSADSAPCEALDELARDADLFVCEAGAPEGVHSELHLTGRQAGEIANRAGVRRLMLTHLKPAADRDRVLAAAREAFSGPVELAVEGLSLEL